MNFNWIWRESKRIPNMSWALTALLKERCSLPQWLKDGTHLHINLLVSVIKTSLTDPYTCRFTQCKQRLPLPCGPESGSGLFLFKHDHIWWHKNELHWRRLKPASSTVCCVLGLVEKCPAKPCLPLWTSANPRYPEALLGMREPTVTPEGVEVWN